MNFTAFTHGLPWHVAGWTMLHFLWVGGLLGLAAALGRRLFRSARPEIRYGFALLFLGAHAVAPGAIAIILIPPAQEGVPRPDVTIQDDASSLVVVPGLPARVPRQDLGASAAIPASASGFDLMSFAKQLDTLANALPWIWVFGSPLTFGLLATGIIGVERFRRQARCLTDGELPEIARRLCAALGVVRPVSLAVCDRVTGPLLIGVIRPLILLPPAVLTGWTPDQIEMALLHELAHIRRHDNLINLIQRVIEALFFFHPAVWWVSGWVRLEREHCCDQLVVTHTGRARPYAEMLATLATPDALSRYGAVAMAERPVVTRIRRILNMEERPMPLSRFTISLAAALFAAPAILIVAQAGTEAPLKPTPTAADRAKLDDLFRQVRRGSDIFNDVQGRANALRSMAIAKAALGDRAAARQLFQEAIALAETVRPEESTYGGHILQWIAQSQVKSGFRDDAIETYRRLLRIVDATVKTEDRQNKLPDSLPPPVPIMTPENDHGKSFIYTNILTAQKDLGDVDGARKTLALVQRYFTELQKDERWYSIATDSLVSLLAISGDLAGALRMVDHPDRTRIKYLTSLKVAQVNGLRVIVSAIGPENSKDADLYLSALRRETEASQESTQSGDLPAYTDNASLRVEHLKQLAQMKATMRGEYLKEIAQALTRLGRFQEALETASAIQTKTPPAVIDDSEKNSYLERQMILKVDILATVGEAQLKAGDKVGARASARLAGATCPAIHQNDFSIHRAIILLAKTGEMAEARKIVDAREPRNRIYAYEEIASVWREAGHQKEAESILREALELARSQIVSIKQTDSSPPSRADSFDRDLSLEQVAHIQALLGDVKGAIKTADEINAYEQSKNVLQQIATERAKAGDLDGALEVISSISSAWEQSKARLSVMSAYTNPR